MLMSDRKKREREEKEISGDSVLLHKAVSSNLTSIQPLSFSEIWRDMDVIIFF